MTYYAKPEYIQYDEWFDDNIDPHELEYEKEKNLVVLFMKSFIKCQSKI